MNIMRDGEKNQGEAGKGIFFLFGLLFAKILAADQSVLTLCPGADCPATKEREQPLSFLQKHF